MSNYYESDLHWADIFAKYINDMFGWNYRPIHPKTPSVPDIDAILTSGENHEDLLLQLTEAREWIETFRCELQDEGTPMFKLNLIGESIRKKEEKYKRQNADISNLILLVCHSIDPDMIQYDVDLAEHKNTNFRGIYVISPPLLRDGQKQNQIVFPIKHAFSHFPPSTGGG